MEVQVFIVILLVLTILVAIAIFLVSQNHKKWEKLIEASALVLGLSRINAPESGFLERVIALGKRSSGRAEVKNVFFADRLDYRIYLFDLYQWSEDDEAASPTSTIFISSVHLNLPRFSLYPKLNLTGMFGSALSNSLNKHIDSASPQQMTKILVETHPEFDQKYALFAASPLEVREMLSDQIITRLAQTERYVVEADGDGFIFGNMNFGFERLRGAINTQKIKTLLEDAAGLYELFKTTRKN